MEIEKQINPERGEQIPKREDQEGELPSFVAHITEIPEQETPTEESKETPPAFPPEPKPEPVRKRRTTPKVQQPKQPTRQVISVAVSMEEYQYLQKIFEARKESGLSGSWNQFIKQCINFSVNHQKGWQFGVPTNIQKVYLD